VIQEYVADEKGQEGADEAGNQVKTHHEINDFGELASSPTN